VPHKKNRIKPKSYVEKRIKQFSWKNVFIIQDNPILDIIFSREFKITTNLLLLLSVPNRVLHLFQACSNVGYRLAYGIGEPAAKFMRTRLEAEGRAGGGTLVWIGAERAGGGDAWLWSNGKKQNIYYSSTQPLDLLFIT
jgi:hypothetical protein